MTILYVDDDEDDIYLFTEVLKDIDNRVSLLTYTDSREALDFLKTTPILPDLVLLDMNMPFMTGKEMLHYLRQDNRFRTLKVVLYSTAKSELEVAEIYAAGAFRFLRKSNTVAGIKADISGILSYTL